MEVAERDFEDIRDKLIEFNGEVPNTNMKKKLIRIDYEYIYELRLKEKEEIDPFTGVKMTRKLIEKELREEVYNYALNSLNVKLNRMMPFDRMIDQLTEIVAKMNEEEEVFQNSMARQNGSKTNVVNKNEFTTNDLLYALETVENLHTTKTTLKPHPGSLERLGVATINIDSPSDVKSNKFIRELTEEELNDIIDPDFDLGC